MRIKQYINTITAQLKVVNASELLVFGLHFISFGCLILATKTTILMILVGLLSVFLGIFLIIKERGLE